MLSAQISKFGRISLNKVKFNAATFIVPLKDPSKHAYMVIPNIAK